MFALLSTGVFNRIHANNLGNLWPMQYLRSNVVANFRLEKLSVAHFCGDFYDPGERQGCARLSDY